MKNTQIKYFITLASTLNFTKASEHLFITQSALSKQIIALEDEIGFKLLTRDKRSVRLTHAGESFLKDMLYIDKSYKEAIHKGLSIHSGINNNIIIGYCGFALFNTLPKLIDEVKKNRPDITLSIRDCSDKYKEQDIFVNGVELCIMPEFQSLHLKELKSSVVFLDDLCVVCNKNHEFAKQDVVTMNELQLEKFVLAEKLPAMHDYEFITNLCVEHGFLPNVVKTTTALHHALLMVNSGFGITVLAKHMECLTNENLVFIPINEARHYFKLLAIWNKVNDQNIRYLVDILKKLYQSGLMR